MPATTLYCGSLAAFANALDDDTLVGLASGADVVVVPTAAAFTGALAAALLIAHVLEDRCAIETLMAIDRAGCAEAYFARRIGEADLVVLADGSALHARTTWRETPVGEALRGARRLVAIGSVAGALGEIMIDPRGGAPTTGLGYRPGLVATTPASAEQLERTRQLLGEDHVLAVLTPTGVLAGIDGAWRIARGEVTVTRGRLEVAL
ncbi:MAG TPA: hypothetical protein VLS91_01135 [Acidimicrobiales bacterium]|nr:hypothetical protein [Acidimicrobiales bacterium]